MDTLQLIIQTLLFMLSLHATVGFINSIVALKVYEGNNSKIIDRLHRRNGNFSILVVLEWTLFFYSCLII